MKPHDKAQRGMAVQIDCESSAKVLFRVMTTLGRQLNKPVILFSENNSA